MKKSEKFKLKTLNVLYWVLMFPLFLLGCVFVIIIDVCDYIKNSLLKVSDFLGEHLYTEDWEFNDPKEESK